MEPKQIFKLISLLFFVNLIETNEQATTVHTPHEIDYNQGKLVNVKINHTLPHYEYIEEEEDDSKELIPFENDNNKATMVIPAKITKEIDAKQMKTVKEMASALNNSYASLSAKLNFFNTELLMKNWENIKNSIGNRCRMDIEEYFGGLKDGVSWALKMDDATGRYSTGFFWGNNYWIGSQKLCLNIAPDLEVSPTTTPRYIKIDGPVSEKLVQSLDLSKSSLNREEKRGEQILNRKRRAADRNTLTPSFNAGYKHGKFEVDVLPPFVPSFYVLKLYLNSTKEVTPYVRILHLGLCMPDSCSEDSIKHIVETISHDSENVEINVASVRSRYQYFNMWEDRTFLILFVVSIIVGSLLFLGTSYDLYLERQANRKKQLSLNCTTYDMTRTEHHLEKQTSLDLGRTGMYVVNNNIPSSSDENLKEGTQNEEQTLGLYSELLLSFSVRINLTTICDQSVGSDTIPVVHGLRFISMIWVILGHTCVIVFKYSDNMEFRKVVERNFFFQTITNGTFSVDTFFFISGLLVSFLYFRTNAKGKLDTLTKRTTNKVTAGAFHFFALLGYRFARLTVPYMFVLGVVEVCMKWFYYNSIFDPPAPDHINCPNYWWRNALYINTLFPLKDMCMLWSWYLADDTQFYVVGVIILIIAISHFKSAAVMLTVFMLSSWATTGYVAFVNKHMPNSDDPLALFDKIYDKPWTRLGPYLIGMCVGWFLFKTDCRIRMSKFTVFAGWTLSTACMLSLVYGLYNVELTPVTAAMYSSLSHTFWAAGLAWIVIACTTGYGGVINQILSATVLYPFSRVTYCAYLVHPLCIRAMLMGMDQPLHLEKGVVAIIFLGQVVASYISSFVISLAFESPIVCILKATLSKAKKIS